MTKRFYLPTFIMLLWFIVAIRWHNLLALPAYIDEGYHTYHASRIWHFPEHPARFADGKLILYFWLGIFTDDTPNQNLFAVRASMALIAIVTASTLALLARQFANKQASLLVLALYAILPYTVFYERMAMSDPLASCFAILLVWRCIVLAKRPTPLQGLIVGLLFALLTLTKLSLATLGALIPFAVLLWGNVRRWQDYLVPFVVAGIAIAVCWLPMAIPIVLSQNTANPMSIVDPMVLTQEVDRGGYIQKIIPEILDFVPLIWWIMGGIALVISLLRQQARLAFFVAVWALLIFIPPVLSASLAVSRYFVPLAVPLILIIVVGINHAIKIRTVQNILAIGVGAYLCGSVLTLSWGIMNDPLSVDLNNQNFSDFQSPSLSFDTSAKKATDLVNNRTEPIIATWWACYIAYFGFDKQPICLDRPVQFGLIVETIAQVLPIGEEAFWISKQHGRDDFLGIREYEWTFIAEFPHEANPERFVYVWKIKRLS